MPYEQPDNDAVDFTLETYDQPTNDNVDFRLDEAAEPTAEEPRGIGSQPISLPLGISLPVSPLNLSTMQMGIAMFLVGIIGILGLAAGFLKNYAAGIMLGLAIVALLFSGLLGIGLELFWVTILATVVLLIMGAVVRWIA